MNETTTDSGTASIAEGQPPRSTTAVGAASTPSPSRGGGRAWLRTALTLIVLLGLAGHSYRKVPTYELLGAETYLQIDAARIRNVGDFLGTFKENLTDGRISAHYYRPVQNLSIALDYWLGELDPKAYQIDSLVVYLLSLLVGYWAMSRLLGPRSWIGPVVMVLFFGLHPLLIQVIPFPCRRSELLAVLFLLAALGVLSQKRPGPGLAVLVAGILVGLACASKESAAVGVGLVFAHQFLFAGGSPARRIKLATLATVPAFTFFGIYFLNRSLVVGGLGGYVRGGEQGYWQALTANVQHIIRDTLCPWPLIGQLAPMYWALISGGVLAAFVVLACLVGPLVSAERARRVAATALLGVLWFAPPLLLLGFSRAYAPWSATMPLAGVAMVAGALAQAGADMMRRGGLTRLAGVVALVGVAVVLVDGLYTSPVAHDYEELAEASDIVREELADLKSRLDEAVPSSSVVIDLFPEYAGTEQNNRPPLTVSLIDFRGVRAWTELVYPRRRIRVSAYVRAQAWRAGNNEILVKVRYIE